MMKQFVLDQVGANGDLPNAESRLHRSDAAPGARLCASTDVAPGDRPVAPMDSDGSTRRPLRVILLGSKEDVTETIKNLHRRGFAPAGEWSEPIACPNSGELISRLVPNLRSRDVVSIHTKYLS